MSEHRKHRHRHYRMGGWVAPLCPMQFPGSPAADVTMATDPGTDASVGVGAGDASGGAV